MSVIQGGHAGVGTAMITAWAVPAPLPAYIGVSRTTAATAKSLVWLGLR
jgi:hypothetical protein